MTDMEKLKKTLESMKATGKGFLCVGTDDPEEAAEIMKMAAELNKPKKEEEKPEADITALKDAYELIEGMCIDCDTAIDHVLDAKLPEDHDLIQNLKGLYDQLRKYSYDLDSYIEDHRPMKKVRVWETVRFSKEVEVPADEDVEAYLDDHE